MCRKNRNGFPDWRYGLFIHYGLYSLLGQAEWIWNREEITAVLCRPGESFLIT
ncbi:MAG: alpha-L-fucosidase [bacterium]